METRAHPSGDVAARLLLAGLILMGTACASTMTNIPAASVRRTGVNTAVLRPETAGGSSPSRRDPLAVTVSTRVASEPALVVVRARIEPDVRNRALTIQWWDAESVGGSHSLSLEGDHAPIRHDCVIKNMAAGEYVVTAVLTRNDGKQVVRHARVVVIGEGGGFDATTYARPVEP